MSSKVSQRKGSGLSTRGQTKVLASKIEMDERQKLVLKKKLQEMNIIAPNSNAQGKAKPDPLRKIQEDSDNRLKKAKQEGMVGELGRLFLRDKQNKNKKSNAGEDDDDDEDAQGLWEGWDEDDQDEENLDLKDEDEWEEEEEAVVPKSKKQKKEKKNKDQNKKGTTDSNRERSAGDPSFRARDESPNAQLELSSIMSNNSEYSPNRKTVEGHTVKVPPIAHPNKQDDVLNFGSKEEGFNKQPTFNGGSQGGNFLGVGTDKDKHGTSRDSRRSSRDELQEGSNRELKRSDSLADAKSQKNSTGSAGKSVSVLQVKKRDKSNLMNNLARIHAQRLEDANEVVKEEDEDDQDREPNDVDWEKRIKNLMEAKDSKRFKIPGERMEERIKKRQDKKDRGLDKWGVKSVPRQKNPEAHKVSYRFKNALEEEERKKLMAVNIEMLHTDELMAYYRELICKGKRDFTEHQKFQNQIKKLEYENTLCNPKSVAKSRSKSPESQNKILQRYVKDNSVQIQVISPDSTARLDGKKATASPTKKGKSTKQKSKSKEKVVMRKTQAF